MAIMELVFRSFYAEQECINRWNYVASGTPAAVSLSFALVSAFGAVYSGGTPPADTLLNAIWSQVTTGVNFGEVEAKNVYSILDFYTRPFAAGQTGGVVTAGMSPSVAIGYRTNRVRSDIRRGTKRFVGVPESSSGDLGVIDSAALTGLQNIATKMGDVLSYDDEGNTITFTPAICSKQEYTTPSGKRAYRYYSTEATQLEHTATGILWELYANTRTQVSRQYGRGR